MAVCCVLVKTASLAVMCCLIWNRRGNEGWWEDTGQGGREEKRGSGRKYGSYQHSPRQENRAMMKAKSREEGKDWQAQTDREWRLKWQRDKQAGVQREWGGEKWTAAMKQETKKRQRERQTDRQTYRQTDILSNTIKPKWIHPGDHQLSWQQIREEAVKQTSNMNRERESRKQQTQRPDNTAAFLRGRRAAELHASLPLAVRPVARQSLVLIS